MCVYKNVILYFSVTSTLMCIRSAIREREREREKERKRERETEREFTYTEELSEV